MNNEHQYSGNTLESSRHWVLITYILYGFGIFNGLTSIIAVMLNYVKRDEVQGTWLKSHVEWQIKTFWWSLLWGIIGTATTFIFIGFLILLVDMIWYIYRIVKGFLAFQEQRSIQ